MKNNGRHGKKLNKNWWDQWIVKKTNECLVKCKTELNSRVNRKTDSKIVKISRDKSPEEARGRLRKKMEWQSPPNKKQAELLPEKIFFFALLFFWLSSFASILSCKGVVILYASVHRTLFGLSQLWICYSCEYVRKQLLGLKYFLIGCFVVLMLITTTRTSHYKNIFIYK